MSEQELKTLVCPSCGNINAYTADECLKCGLALGPVRELLAGAVVPKAEEVTPRPAKSEEPAPPMLELPARPETEKIGQYVDSWRFLIRGMGDRAEEIAARFFKQLAGREIEGLKLNVGQLVIDIGGGKQDSRDYYFVERDLGEGAVATMAVRIAPTGTDLFVEWRHHVFPSEIKTFDWGTFLVVSSVASLAGFVLALVTELFPTIFPCSSSLVGIVVGIAMAHGKGKGRAASLEGFQSQDSTAFQLAVRAALEEAIDLAGISKALIQELPKGEGEERRVI